jgi:hypothetical protein
MEVILKKEGASKKKALLTREREPFLVLYACKTLQRRDDIDVTI